MVRNALGPLFALIEHLAHSLRENRMKESSVDRLPAAQQELTVFDERFKGHTDTRGNQGFFGRKRAARRLFPSDHPEHQQPRAHLWGRQGPGIGLSNAFVIEFEAPTLGAGVGRIRKAVTHEALSRSPSADG